MSQTSERYSGRTSERTCAMTPDEIASFRRDGFFGPFKVYEIDEMRRTWQRERLRMLDRSHAVYTEDAAMAGNTNIANYDRHLDMEFLARHVTRAEIVDRVTSVLGPDVLCWRTEFFPKYPGDEGTDWHQADTFANASGTRRSSGRRRPRATAARSPSGRPSPRRARKPAACSSSRAPMRRCSTTRPGG